jgi:hypothetical protein
LARHILPVVLALLCAGAACREFRSGVADHLAEARTPDGLRRALQHTPDDAAKWRRLGIALIRAEAGGAAPALERAVRLFPHDAEALLALGLEAERAGRIDDAGRFYLRAAGCSRRFRPHYALAGFYLRRGDLDRFWPAASQAVNTPAADVAPVIRLASQTGAAVDDLPALLQLRTDDARAAWLAYALAAESLDAAPAVAVKLTPKERYRPLLLHTCERLIQTGRSEGAVAVWNHLPGASPIDLSAGRSLAGGDFAEAGYPGFYWSYTALPGTALRTSSAGGFRISFSGDQPERGELVHKVVPVLGGRRYRLTLPWSTDGLDGPTGLTWTLAPLNGAPIATLPLDPGDTGVATAEFATPPSCTLLRLMLGCARLTGRVRIAGTVHVQGAKLELLR